jgi:hypothetical protein
MNHIEDTRFDTPAKRATLVRSLFSVNENTPARWIASCIYALVALIWLIPDRRIERVVDESKPTHSR